MSDTGQNTAAARVLEDFAGAWHLAKRIENAIGPDGRFEGAATWEPDGAGLLYRESGRLWVGDGAPLEAERCYLWRPGLEVYFDDGRFFHSVPPMGGEARHHCPPDDYAVEYHFGDWPAFETIWQVTGPRKSYVMTARYTR